MGKIFHGGCHGCTNQDFRGISYCKKCMYFNFDAFSNKPNRNSKDQREEYDPVSGKTYHLSPDEKLVHVHRGYELDENGEVFQPLVTEIAKLTEDNSLIMSDELASKEVHRQGGYINADGDPVFNEDKPTDAPIVGHFKKFGLIDELQKETNEWLVGAV